MASLDLSVLVAIFPIHQADNQIYPSAIENELSSISFHTSEFLNASNIACIPLMLYDLSG